MLLIRGVEEPSTNEDFFVQMAFRWPRLVVSLIFAAKPHYLTFQPIDPLDHDNPLRGRGLEKGNLPQTCDLWTKESDLGLCYSQPHDLHTLVRAIEGENVSPIYNQLRSWWRQANDYLNGILQEAQAEMVRERGLQRNHMQVHGTEEDDEDSEDGAAGRGEEDEEEDEEEEEEEDGPMVGGKNRIITRRRTANNQGVQRWRWTG